LFFIETIKEDNPNKPVNSGRSGSFIGRFNVIKPKNPDNIKMVSGMKNCFSLKMRYNDMKISKKGKAGRIVL